MSRTIFAREANPRDSVLTADTTLIHVSRREYDRASGTVRLTGTDVLGEPITRTFYASQSLTLVSRPGA